MNEIIPNLFLGTFTDGHQHQYDMHVLSVQWECEPTIPPKAMNIPTTGFLMKIKGGGTDAYAIPIKMDQAADWIHDRLQRGEKVLVHCLVGVERSPLTVVWYLMRHHNMTLQEAYELVIEKRKEAQYRGYWLPLNIRINGRLSEPEYA